MTTYSVADSIPSGTPLSAGVAINGIDVVGLTMSAGWDAATITVQQSVDGANWNEIYDLNGNNIVFVTAAGRYIALPPSILAGCAWLRIRSGSSGTPVNQTATRALFWQTRNYGR